MSVTPDHPKQRLLLALEPDFDEFTVGRVKSLVDGLREARVWTLGPPQFVNESEPGDEPGESPTRTVGAILDLYAGHGEWADKLPADLDRAHFEEASALVEAFAELSRATGVEVAVELDQDQVGWIEAGIPDHGVAEVFLGEWRRSLRSV